MDAVTAFLQYPIAFLAVLTVVVFVHELGHYWVGRRCGVGVEIFSIGFGPELVGWNDRHGTRWKISLVPLGGYVKFFGDASAASTPGDVSTLNAADRARTLQGRPVWQRMAVVAAGPAANFIFAIVVYAGIFSILGQPFTPAVVGSVRPASAAEAAGLQPGDRILAVDGRAVARFEELRQIVALSADTPILLRLQRGEGQISLTATPQRSDVPDGLGGTQRIGLLGVTGGAPEFVRHGPVQAVWQAVRETGSVITGSLTYIGRMITGREDGTMLSGPVGIAKVAGDVAKISWIALISLAAALSVGIGLINLFPVPMLDGGHLLFYAIEAIRGRPLGERVQEFGFRIGLTMVLSLFLFVTWNDLQRLQLWSFIRGLFA